MPKDYRQWKGDLVTDDMGEYGDMQVIDLAGPDEATVQFSVYENGDGTLVLNLYASEGVQVEVTVDAENEGVFKNDNGGVLA